MLYYYLLPVLISKLLQIAAALIDQLISSVARVKQIGFQVLEPDKSAWTGLSAYESVAHENGYAPALGRYLAGNCGGWGNIAF